MAQTFPHAFDIDEQPIKWREAMRVLSGVRLQLELRGFVGAASLAKWK